MDAADGDTLWYYTYADWDLDKGVRASPSIYGSDVFVGSNEDWGEVPNYDGAIYRFALDYQGQGSPPWIQVPANRHGFGCRVFGTTAVANDHVYVPTGRGFFRLSLALAEVWELSEYGEEGVFLSSPAVATDP